MIINYKKIKCRSFLHHFKNKYLPFNWGANPYRGCEHSCPYCFARYTHEYIGFNTGNDFETKILVKENAAKVLEKELSHPSWRGSIVEVGSVCDPYQPAEKKFKITRQVLKVFEKHKNPVIVATKSNLVSRDIDLLSKMAGQKNIAVYMTITTLDEEIRCKIEPNAPPSYERLLAMKKLSDAGIPVSVLFMPIFPYLTDSEENIKGVIKAVSKFGAVDVVYGILGMRASCRDRVFSLIKKEYPELLNKYIHFYKRKTDTRNYRERIHREIEREMKINNLKREMPHLREKQTRISNF